MRRYVMAALGGYAGAVAMAFLLYRAAYVRTSAIRSWTDGMSQELTRLLDQLRGELRDLHEQVRATPVKTAD